MGQYKSLLGIILAASIAISLIFAVAAYSNVRKDAPLLLDYTRISVGVDNALQTVLIEHGIYSSDISYEQMRLASRENQQWNYYYREITMLGGEDLFALERRIMTALAPWGVKLSARESGIKDERAYYKVRLSLPQGITTHSLLFYVTEIEYHPAEPEGVPMEEVPDPPRQTVLPPEPRSIIADTESDRPIRLAIILDDAGDNFQLAQRAVSIHPAITLSILPQRPFSREIAQMMQRLGLEYMLHQPMEALNPLINPGWAALSTDMDDTEIRKTLRAALEAVPGVAGINNHMGSKFTQDDKRMATVMEVIAQENIYFIDSYTTSESVGHLVAQQHAVPTGFRDVFIDNEGDVESILKQLDLLLSQAQAYGSAIGIGHVRSSTLNALEIFSNTLDEHGVQLVSPSQIVTPNGQFHSTSEQRSNEKSPSVVGF